MSDTYHITVLNGLSFTSTPDFVLSTNVYEYSAKVDSAMTGVDFKVEKAADEYSLNAMNIYNGSRGFNFSFFDESSTIYNIGADLDDTALGSFVVQGYNGDASNSVISGALKNGFGNGSLFKLINATNLTLKNLTIEDTYSATGGSVLNMSNGGAVATLNNLVVQNNNNLVGAAIQTSDGLLNIINAIFSNNMSQNDDVATGVGGSAISATNTTVTLGDDIEFSQNGVNSATSDTGAIYANDSTFIFGNNALFENNIGGAIYAKDSTFTFGENAKFTQNHSTNGAGAMTFISSDVNFNGGVLIENNYKQGYLNSFDLALTTINLNSPLGNLINIRDPMTSDSSSIVNFTGKDMYLWGDNSNFFGTLNINDGNFYLMFDEVDLVNDPHSQRVDGLISNATITFDPSAVFLPKITGTQLASLTGSTVSASGTIIQPYGLSNLNIGTYTFDGVDYSAFDGWNRSLSSFSSSGGDTKVVVKRNLEGYETLTALADAYRKTDLNIDSRYEMDEIYRTGIVSQNILDNFGGDSPLGGQDYLNFEQAHRVGVREYNRQVNSRLNNRDCYDCGRDDNYSDDHAWLNIGHNFVHQDSTSGSLGYDYKPTSIAFGYDNNVTPKTIKVGAAFGYSNGEAKTKKGSVASSDKINQYTLSVYGKYKPSEIYANYNVGGALMNNSTKFTSSLINSVGHYNTYGFFAHNEIGYQYEPTKVAKITPYIGLEYTYIYSEGYKEKGISGRHFNSSYWNIFETPIGLRFSKDINDCTHRLMFTPMLDAAYSHNWGDTGASTRAYFVGNATDSWSVNETSKERDSFRGAINLKINSLDDPYALNFGYATDIRKDYNDNQFYATFRWDF